MGKDHVVVASDRLGHTNDAAGMYGFKCAKLRSIRAGEREWVVGMAGSDMAITLVDNVAVCGSALDGRWAMHYLSEVYAEDLRRAATKSGCDEPMWFLFAGVDSRGPFIYRLTFDGVKWSGPGEHHGNHTAIGTECHGAMYFMSEHHVPEMSEQQRIQLAHFCITEAAKHDMRVEGPAYMAVAGSGNVRFISESDVPEVVNRSAAISKSIRSLLFVTQDEITVDKSKFDVVLRRMINTPPQTFKEVVAQPKLRKDGGVKRSAKKSGRSQDSAV